MVPPTSSTPDTPAERPGLLDALMRGRSVSPRRRRLGTLGFLCLLALAFLLAPRPALRVVNASSEALHGLRVCLGEQCESRETLEAGAHWNVPLRVTQDASAKLVLSGTPKGQGAQAYVTPGQRLDFRVRAPDVIDLISR
ncbi:hypothetical protein [Deinococcus peraridilitoris]|uniref:Uncharacterized protein n=1 Tax=Deinococcus peraridilitoris (strain DSM 19664 / LMG 22246 / CIP 109416 / KR-200) TaxID=937777 RepID=L0A3Y4_DEIPD|nr:hypothetical protein [Deinococcus peraridilitoris]AFZ68124.1 hypothetical protein Deipe_2659 [Deinococcus peraridilitoris DSM 19664]